MRKAFKTIALTLTLLLPLQSAVFPLSRGAGTNFLQPRLIFSDNILEDDFSQIVSGYLSFYLSENENDPDLTNIPRIKRIIDGRLSVLRSLDIIPTEFREKLPELSVYDAEHAAIVIDLGKSKIRYFDHNIPGADMFAGRDEERYTVISKKVGKYLTRQVISRKKERGSETYDNKKGTESKSSLGKNVLRKIKRSGKELAGVVKDLIPGMSVDKKNVPPENKSVLNRDKLDPGIQGKVTAIVEHYGDKKNITLAETRYTPQGHLYAPSSSVVLLKIAAQFINGKGTKVLDLGYGGGKAAAIFSLFSDHVTGVEIDRAGGERGKSPGLAEAGMWHIEELSKAGLVNKSNKELIKGAFLSDEFDMSDFEPIYIYWPYTTEESADQAARIVDKLTDAEKGLGKNAVFIVNAPSREALRVFFPVLKEVNIEYADWKELRTLGRLLFAFNRPGDIAAEKDDQQEKPYASDEARAILNKWRSLTGMDNTGLIDVYYSEEELMHTVEATGFTPKGVIYGQSETRDLIEIGERFLSGKDKKVLDAGSGAGKAVAVFSCFADHVTGMEIDSMARTDAGGKRLFEVGKERIDFLAGEGIIDGNKIELTDDDIFAPETELSDYDVVYHYWGFPAKDSGKYIEKFTKKILDPEKGLRPGSLFIVNTLLKGLIFPGLEKLDVSIGKNITVYRRPADKKEDGAGTALISEVSSFPISVNGAWIQNTGGAAFELSAAEGNNDIELYDAKGKRVGEILLSFPKGDKGKEIHMDKIKVYSAYDDEGIEEGFLRLLSGKLNEGYSLVRDLQERETVKYLEKLYDDGKGINEQRIIKKYDPSFSCIGRRYLKNGFGMQVVRLKKGPGPRRYELIAFRSDGPYSYRKSVNMLIKQRFGKWGSRSSHLSLDPNGKIFSVSISLLDNPSEHRLVKNIHDSIIKDLAPGASILSVGVGTGAIAGMFVESGCRVSGVDISPEVLKKAAEKGIRTIEADASLPDFWEKEENGSKYDIVMFCESLEYFDDPGKIFRMAKSVLSEKGKIYIVARDIPGKKRYKKYEKALENAGFSIDKGSNRMFFGNNAGVRTLSGVKMTYERIDKEKIIKGNKGTIPRLIHHMMFLAPRDDAVYNQEKVVLLLDKELSTINKDPDVIRNTIRLINTLAAIKGNNPELACFLNNLEIIPVRGSGVGRGQRFREDQNIIAVTKTSNKDRFESINSEVLVAAVKEEDFPEGGYLPLLEISLFAIGKYLDLDPALLRRYYENIPQVKTLQELTEDGEFSGIFDADVRSFVIQLPHARNFNASKDLVETMEIIRGLLQKA